MNPIVGIGEVLWDVYPDGRKVAGGAPFNFAFHCHQLGHPAVIVSRVGDDDLGRELRERVRELDLSDEYIQTDHEHPTGTVQVKLDANAVPTYTITENVAWDYLERDRATEQLAKSARVFCHGTLAQRSARGMATITALVELASRAGAFLVFDVNLRPPHSGPLEFWEASRFANWIKLNRDEFGILTEEFSHQLVGRSIHESLLASFFTEHNTLEKRVILTWGDRGVAVASRNELIDEPGVPARVVDTVGAGDAFTAAMVCLHLEGRPLRECARFANHYAARVCEQPGGTPRIDRSEVERASGVK